MTNMPGILVTGSCGFVGRHLVHAIREKHKDAEVYGASDKDESGCEENAHFVCDINDETEVFRILQRITPDRIFHLAAISSPSIAESSPLLTYRVNFMGSVHVLEAARSLGKKVKILLVGTSECYRFTGKEKKVAETIPGKPKNHYGISKYVAEQVAIKYAQYPGLEVVCTRSFNHSGPGQQPGFVIPDFAKQVALAALGRGDEIHVGNLDVVRDFLDVRDVVEAYLLLMEKGANGEIYNVCSGRGVLLSDMLDMLIKTAAVQHVKVRQPGSKKRKGEIHYKVGDNTKLCGLGWAPKFTIEDMLKDTYTYWKTAVS
jgi:GDP-4-dehydro-6-deoxy-D-mannose reductase